MACRCPSRLSKLDLQSSIAMALGRARAVPLLIGEDGRDVGKDEGGGSSSMWVVGWVDLA